MPSTSLNASFDLHHHLSEDKYIETYRETDLRPGYGQSLVYSQKIEDPDLGEALGTLCLCFDFEDEMCGIFKDLNQGNPQIIVAILDAGGSVMCASNASILPPAKKVVVDLEADFRFLTFNGRTYLTSMVATDGYQGFYGLTWYAMAMIEIDVAFKTQASGKVLDKALVDKLQEFSGNYHPSNIHPTNCWTT